MKHLEMESCLQQKQDIITGIPKGDKNKVNSIQKL